MKVIKNLIEGRNDDLSSKLEITRISEGSSGKEMGRVISPCQVGGKDRRG